jgi:hypothetical protein
VFNRRNVKESYSTIHLEGQMKIQSGLTDLRPKTETENSGLCGKMAGVKHETEDGHGMAHNLKTAKISPY